MLTILKKENYPKIYLICMDLYWPLSGWIACKEYLYILPQYLHNQTKQCITKFMENVNDLKIFKKRNNFTILPLSHITEYSNFVNEKYSSSIMTWLFLYYYPIAWLREYILRLSLFLILSSDPWWHSIEFQKISIIQLKTANNILVIKKGSI